MKRYEAFFLDVDGTLIDSIRIKNNVFIEVLEKEGIPEVFSKSHIEESIAKTRKERFSIVWRNFHSIEIPVEILSRLLKRSEHILLESQIEPLPGVDIFLSNFSQKSKLHVVSAANHNEVIKIFKRFGWVSFFRTIDTEVTNKSKIFDELKKDFLYFGESCLSVGDTQSDYDSAIQSGVDFWHIQNNAHSILTQNKFLVGSSPDFFELLNHLED